MGHPVLTSTEIDIDLVNAVVVEDCKIVTTRLGVGAWITGVRA